MGDRPHEFGGPTYSFQRPPYLYAQQTDESYLAGAHPAHVIHQKAGSQALSIDGCSRDAVPAQGAYVNGTTVPSSINPPIPVNTRNNLIPMNQPIQTGRGNMQTFPYPFPGARNLSLEPNIPSTVGDVPVSANLPLVSQRGQDFEMDEDIKRGTKRQLVCADGWREGQEVFSSALSFERRVSKRGKIPPMALVVLLFPDGRIDLSHETLKLNSDGVSDPISDKTRKIYKCLLTSLQADVHDWNRNSAIVECASLMDEQTDPLQPPPESLPIQTSMAPIPIIQPSQRKTKLNESRSLKEEAQRIVPDLKIRQSEWCSDKAVCAKKADNHECGPKRAEVGWPDSLPFVHPARFNKEECKKILEWWRQKSNNSAAKAETEDIFTKPKHM